MRDFRCKFALSGQKMYDHACWAQLNSSVYPKGSSIWIDDYRYKDTEEYIELIVKVINEIQPCKLIEHEGKTYIEYKLIGLYNNDLILLNFVRNLWNEHQPGYSLAFFKKLKTLRNSKKYTAFEKLTAANVHAVEVCNKKGIGNHSNCHEGVQIRKLPDNFYTTQLYTTKSFLCD